MTSAEYADEMTPRVRQVMKGRKPLSAIAWGPFLGMLVKLVLQMLPLLMADPTKGAASAPGAVPLLPYRDDEGDVPQDVRRACL
jgi:hypothetical protein